MDITKKREALIYLTYITRKCFHPQLHLLVSTATSIYESVNFHTGRAMGAIKNDHPKVRNREKIFQHARILIEGLGSQKCPARMVQNTTDLFNFVLVPCRQDESFPDHASFPENHRTLFENFLLITLADFHELLTETVCTRSL